MNNMKPICLIAIIILACAICTCSVCASNAEVNVGDVIVIGSYKNTPIEWQVLELNGDNVLVISTTIQCKRPYNTVSSKFLNWGNCSLRTWLNNDFLTASFNEEQIASIQLSHVDNSSVQHRDTYGTIGSQPDTDDKVFLLSWKEVCEYFPTEESRICQGSSWWTRSCGENPGTALVVGADGNMGYGNETPENENGIRPAMWISLSSIQTAFTSSDENSTTPDSEDGETAENSALPRVPVLSEMFPGSEAHLRKSNDDGFRVYSYAGPGKSYVPSGGYKPYKQRKITVYFAENDFVLADVLYQTSEERFVYLPRYSFDSIQDIPTIETLEFFEGITIKKTTPSWGPDNRFNSVASLAINEGTSVKVFFQENGFVYAEYNCEKGTVRMWLPANDVDVTGASVSYSNTPINPAGQSSFK